MVGGSMSLEEQIKAAKAAKVVRIVGQPNKILIDGVEIVRRDKIHIPKIGVMTCAPYDNHFVYRYAKNKGWTLFCTCGSAAVITGYDMYKEKNAGAILSCYNHLLEGRHADGSN
jgi:hypothetical protein